MGLFKYINETRSEMKHVAWPTQKQTSVFTALVIVVSILVSLYLGIFDLVFTRSLEGALKVIPGRTISQPAGTSTGTSTDSGEPHSGSMDIPEGLEFTTTPIVEGEGAIEVTPVTE